MNTHRIRKILPGEDSDASTRKTLKAMLNQYSKEWRNGGNRITTFESEVDNFVPGATCSA